MAAVNKNVWYSKNTSNKSADTVHQILMFGTLSEIDSLKKSVGEKTIKEFFLQRPKKIYTPSALHFIKSFILQINIPIDESKYLKYTSRNI